MPEGPWWVPLAQSVVQAVGVLTAASLGFILWRRRLDEERAKAETLQRVQEVAAERRRSERVRDVLIALQAELDVDRERLALTFSDAEIEPARKAMLALVKGPGAKQMPQGVSEDGYIVFDSIKADFTLLPPKAIAPVVRYYRYARMLSVLDQEMAKFEGIDDQRQMAAINQYIDMGQKTYRLALDAIAVVNDQIAAHSSPNGANNLKMGQLAG